MWHLWVQTGICLKYLRERVQVQDLDVDVRTILNKFLRSEMERHELYCGGSGKGQVSGVSACCNISLGSVKCGEFLDYLRTILFLKTDSVPRT